jgi:molecular chaperone GrpE (heat shock protein)
VNHADALEAALLAAPRDDDGNVDVDVLIKMIADVLDDPDVEAVKLAAAKQIVKQRQSPGSTEADGVLQLFDTYPYEPSRLVADDQGHVIEQDLAKPTAKQAEARRAQRNAENVQRHARRKVEEASRYSDWMSEELRSGAPWASITFGRFVRDTFAWQAGDIIDPIPPGDDF